MQVLIGVVALALAASAHAKASDLEDGINDPALSFFIFAGISTVIVAIIQLCLQISKNNRRAASVAVACSCYGVIVWIAGVGALGGYDSDMFNIKDYCGADAYYVYYVYSDEGCKLLRLFIAAWAFGLFALLLWVVSLIFGSMGLCTAQRLQAKTARSAISQPMHTIHQQPYTAGNLPQENAGPAAPAYNQYHASPGSTHYSQPHQANHYNQSGPYGQTGLQNQIGPYNQSGSSHQAGIHNQAGQNYGDRDNFAPQIKAAPV